MEVIDFIIIRGQQSFEAEKTINPIDIKIENDQIQNIFDKYKKNTIRFKGEGLLFSSGITNDTEKIFLVTNGLADTKYGLINGIMYQVIGVINLNEIEKWEEIKNSSRWVNVNFQAQNDNRQTKHFSYEFLTKNRRDLLNFSLRLVDPDNKDIKFIDGEKKFPILNFLIEFLA